MGSERKRGQVCFWDFVLSSWKGGSSLTKMGRPRMGQERGSGEENVPSGSVMFEVSTSHPGGKASLEVGGEIQAGATTLRAIHREIMLKTMRPVDINTGMSINREREVLRTEPSQPLRPPR